MQPFLLYTDECTRTVAAQAGKEDVNRAVVPLSQEIFKNDTVRKSVNGLALRSKKVGQWAGQ